MLTTPTVSEPVLLAFDWLLNSGIQDIANDSRFKGGVYAWYDLNSENYPFVYSEITGYAINAFLFFHAVSKDQSYLDRARLAGDWLIQARDSKYGLIVNRVYRTIEHEPYFHSWVFTFDQWIVLYGLCNLYEVVHDEKYLFVAEEIAKFLLQNTFNEDGSMLPIFDLEKRMAQATNDKWSRQSGSFHAKALMGLSRLYELTRNKEYLIRALKLAEYSVQLQQEDGRFVTQLNEQSTHLHPHLYSIEGLLYFGLLYQHDRFISACKKSLEWVLTAQASDGAIYSFFKDQQFLPCVRSDVLAQTLRLSTIMIRNFDEFKRFSASIEQLRAKLLLYQVRSKVQKGGFLFGEEQDSSVHNHVNAWATMFSAQALYLYDTPELKELPLFSFFV